MSLRIDHPTKPKIVWKVYRQEVNTKNKFELISPYQGQKVIFKPNEILKSSRRTTRLSKSEIADCNVDNGLHVYTGYDDAHAAAKLISFGGYERGVIVAFLADPTKLVATGYFGRVASAVYTQLMMNSIQAYFLDQRLISPE